MNFTEHFISTEALKTIARRHGIYGEDWLEKLHQLFKQNKWQWPSEI